MNEYAAAARVALGEGRRVEVQVMAGEEPRPGDHGTVFLLFVFAADASIECACRIDEPTVAALLQRGAGLVREDGPTTPAQPTPRAGGLDGDPFAPRRRARSLVRPTTSVLVIDDDADAGEAVADLLREAGYVIRRADNGAAALASMRDWRPSVVVLDLMMPVLDGWAMLQRMREDARLVGVPVCVLTAVVDEAVPAQAWCMLRKPVPAATLLAAIQALVHVGAGRA